MQLQNIQADTRFQLDITSNDYSDTNLNRSLNKHYNNLFPIIMQVMGEWEVQGKVAKADLVANQDNYSIPTDLLQLKRVELNYTGGADTWVRAKILDISEVDIALSNSTEYWSTANPYVRVFNNNLYLEPTPTANVTAGLRVWYTLQFTDLSGATDEPNIPDCGVDYLIHGACLDFAIGKRQADVNMFLQLMENDKERIIDYYSKKLPARKHFIRRNKQSFK